MTRLKELFKYYVLDTCEGLYKIWLTAVFSNQPEHEFLQIKTAAVLLGAYLLFVAIIPNTAPTQEDWDIVPQPEISFDAVEQAREEALAQVVDPPVTTEDPNRGPYRSSEQIFKPQPLPDVIKLDYLAWIAMISLNSPNVLQNVPPDIHWLYAPYEPNADTPDPEAREEARQQKYDAIFRNIPSLKSLANAALTTDPGGYFERTQTYDLFFDYCEAIDPKLITRNKEMLRVWDAIKEYNQTHELGRREFRPEEIKYVDQLKPSGALDEFFSPATANPKWIDAALLDIEGQIRRPSLSVADIYFLTAYGRYHSQQLAQIKGGLPRLDQLEQTCIKAGLITQDPDPDDITALLQAHRRASQFNSPNSDGADALRSIHQRLASSGNDWRGPKLMRVPQPRTDGLVEQSQRDAAAEMLYQELYGSNIETRVLDMFRGLKAGGMRMDVIDAWIDPWPEVLERLGYKDKRRQTASEQWIAAHQRAAVQLNLIHRDDDFLQALIRQAESNTTLPRKELAEKVRHMKHLFANLGQDSDHRRKTNVWRDRPTGGSSVNDLYDDMFNEIESNFDRRPSRSR